MCGENRPSRPLAGDSFDLLYCSLAGRLRGQDERGTQAYLKSRLSGQLLRRRDDALCLHDRLALRMKEGDVLGGQLKVLAWASRRCIGNAIAEARPVAGAARTWLTKPAK